jgi:hypothetical protein
VLLSARFRSRVLQMRRDGVPAAVAEAAASNPPH